MSGKDEQKPTALVSLQRAEYETLLNELENAEDRIAVLEHALAARNGTLPEPLTIEEADRLINGENPVRIWREKRGHTQSGLAAAAGISKTLLSEIENNTKTGSVETLRKLAHELKVDLDTLVP
jgi:DNA-binding XRE family transcriptional regulator